MPLDRSVIREDVFEDELIDGTDSVFSDPIYIGKTSNQSVWVQTTSVAGTPDIKLEYFCSPSTDATQFVKPEGVIDLSVDDENPHLASISIPVTRYLKIKVTGVASNPSDTIVTIYIQHT